MQLWPAGSRPYVGGSTDDSVLQLALGYNGLSRLDGSGAGPRAGDPGLLRLFGAELGGQVAWLLPAALVALVAGLVWTARRPRTDPLRAGLLVWGGWLLVSGLVLSLMSGTFHGYYTVAVAPAIAVLVGIGAGMAGHRGARPVLAGTVALTVVWSWVLLGRSAGFVPWLRWAVLVVGVLAAVGLLVVGLRRVAAAVAVVAVLAGPAAYSVQTVATAHTGSTPTAGPAVDGGTSAFARGGPGRTPGGSDDGQFPGRPPGQDRTGQGDRPGSAFGEPTASPALVSLLGTGAGSYRWTAATIGSQTAALYQLATGDPVMAIGGFSGRDPSPTLAQFQAWIAAGDVHWFIGDGAGRGGDGPATQIGQWVASTFIPRTVDGETVYDLTSPAS
ncbi:hypothetical protein [Klenkia sp. PcliD-1-E]|uniref:hypothetical protein n=1 Tax=Klenkia sp. PcliD-1-E TaxID=2954492 RepID=UPI002096A4ED|nr:hypothetical protein [Klenkia sp. PcliD-1-E]MCO7220947.1 hypothetical protein [Klenkia sp. PcliD-1-E]